MLCLALPCVVFGLDAEPVVMFGEVAGGACSSTISDEMIDLLLGPVLADATVYVVPVLAGPGDGKSFVERMALCCSGLPHPTLKTCAESLFESGGVKDQTKCMVTHSVPIPLRDLEAMALPDQVAHDGDDDENVFVLFVDVQGQEANAGTSSKALFAQTTLASLLSVSPAVLLVAERVDRTVTVSDPIVKAVQEFSSSGVNVDLNDVESQAVQMPSLVVVKNKAENMRFPCETDREDASCLAQEKLLDTQKAEEEFERETLQAIREILESDSMDGGEKYGRDETGAPIPLSIWLSDGLRKVSNSDVVVFPHVSRAPHQGCPAHVSIDLNRASRKLLARVAMHIRNAMDAGNAFSGRALHKIFASSAASLLSTRSSELQRRRNSTLAGASLVVRDALRPDLVAHVSECVIRGGQGSTSNSCEQEYLALKGPQVEELVNGAVVESLQLPLLEMVEASLKDEYKARLNSFNFPMAKVGCGLDWKGNLKDPVLDTPSVPGSFMDVRASLDGSSTRTIAVPAGFHVAQSNWHEHGKWFSHTASFEKDAESRASMLARTKGMHGSAVVKGISFGLRRATSTAIRNSAAWASAQFTQEDVYIVRDVQVEKTVKLITPGSFPSLLPHVQQELDQCVDDAVAHHDAHHSQNNIPALLLSCKELFEERGVAVSIEIAYGKEKMTIRRRTDASSFRKATSETSTTRSKDLEASIGLVSVGGIGASKTSSQTDASTSFGERGTESNSERIENFSRGYLEAVPIPEKSSVVFWSEFISPGDKPIDLLIALLLQQLVFFEAEHTVVSNPEIYVEVEALIAEAALGVDRVTAGGDLPQKRPQLAPSMMTFQPLLNEFAAAGISMNLSWAGVQGHLVPVPVSPMDSRYVLLELGPKTKLFYDGLSLYGCPGYIPTPKEDPSVLLPGAPPGSFVETPGSLANPVFIDGSGVCHGDGYTGDFTGFAFAEVDPETGRVVRLLDKHYQLAANGFSSSTNVPVHDRVPHHERRLFIFTIQVVYSDEAQKHLHLEGSFNGRTIVASDWGVMSDGKPYATYVLRGNRGEHLEVDAKFVYRAGTSGALSEGVDN